MEQYNPVFLTHMYIESDFQHIKQDYYNVFSENTQRYVWDTIYFERSIMHLEACFTENEQDIWYEVSQWI